MVRRYRKRWNALAGRARKAFARYRRSWRHSKLAKARGRPQAGALIVLGLIGVASIDMAAVKSTAPQTKVTLKQRPEAMKTVAKRLPDGPWGYFRPAWETTGFFFPVGKDEIADVTPWLDDPSNRVEKEFKVPAYMRERVLFWMKIQSVYDSRMRLVHDKSHPDLIYGYIDFTPLFVAMGPGIPTEVKANQLERQILKEIKARLGEAGGLTKTSMLSAEERENIRVFLSNAGGLSPSATAELVNDIRTQTGQKDEFVAALERSRLLLPHIESVFRRAGLPIALGRIPFVESSFHLRAHSKVGAVGIWQFMPETARQMIHPDNEKLWADPLRQTAAATKLLKIFRSLLPDWGTTVTSYNSGVGRIRRLVQKYGARDMEGILKIPAPDKLGFAGINFYAQFLAANLVEAYKEELFEGLLGPQNPALVFKGILPFPPQSCEM